MGKIVRRRKKGWKRKGRRAPIIDARTISPAPAPIPEPEPVAKPPSFSLLAANNHVSTLMNDENKPEDNTTSTNQEGKFHTHYVPSLL